MLSDKEIAVIDAKAQTFAQFARAILAAYQAKLLVGVEMPEYKYIDRHDVPKEGMCVYTQDQLLAYGDARDQAGYLRGLDEAKCWHVLQNMQTGIGNMTPQDTMRLAQEFTNKSSTSSKLM